MSLKSFISNLFSSKNKVNKVKSKDSYCYSDIIWNDEDNLIILISYSEDYNESVIEILDAANQFHSRLLTKVVFSSYDEETDKKDEDGNTIWIIHEKRYLLIGGPVREWNSLYFSISTLSNPILDKISGEIVNNCSARDFEYLINDRILSDFKYSKIKPFTYDKPSVYMNCKTSNIDTIIQRLPNAFKSRDIIKFIIVNKPNVVISLYDVIFEIQHMSEEKFRDTVYYNIFKHLFKTDPTIEKITEFTQPLYKQADMDDDFIPGDISDESLDEIFRKDYERFSAVRDDDISFNDIDEILADDDENMNGGVDNGAY